MMVENKWALMGHLSNVKTMLWSVNFILELGVVVNSLTGMLNDQMWLYYGECFVGISFSLPLGGSVVFVSKRMCGRITYIKSLALNQWAWSDVARVKTARSYVSASAYAAAKVMCRSVMSGYATLNLKCCHSLHCCHNDSYWFFYV